MINDIFKLIQEINALTGGKHFEQDGFTVDSSDNGFHITYDSTKNYTQYSTEFKNYVNALAEYDGDLYEEVLNEISKNYSVKDIDDSIKNPSEDTKIFLNTFKALVKKIATSKIAHYNAIITNLFISGDGAKGSDICRK